MNRQHFLPLALVILTLARLAILPHGELSPPEAHAAVCAARFELWHPLTGPVLPLLMKISTAVFGWNEFGVRFFAPFAMLAAGALVWRIALGLFGETAAGWALVVFQITPVVNLASVTFTTTTLGIVESAGLLALLRIALHRRWPWHLEWWAVALTVMAACFTDWRLVMLVIAGTASLALTRRGRSALMKWPVLPVLTGTFALAMTVFFAWNSEHRWAAFHFFPDPSTGSFKTAVRAALLAHGPVTLLLAAWALARTALERPLSYPAAFLFAFAVPLFSLDLLAMPFDSWPQAGFCAWLPPMTMLAAAQVIMTGQFSMRVKIWLRSAVVILAALHSLLLLQHGSVRPFPLPWQKEAQRDSEGWRAAASVIREAVAREKLDPGSCFIVADRWQLAAPLAFYLRDTGFLQPTDAHPRVHVLADDRGRTPFATWPRDDSGAGKARFESATLLYVTDDDARHVPPRPLRESRPQFRVIARSAVMLGDDLLRTVTVFACAPRKAADK